MKRNNGVVLWQGKSRIDGSPIAVILTGFSGSANRKTGNMIQSWIIRTDIDPMSAVRTGKDFSVCGNCPHRGVNGKGRVCYVKVFQAPLSVYRCFKRGGYRNIQETGYSILEGQILRIGSYGDPSMIPADVWIECLKYCRVHTGYTHQWRIFQDLKGIVQASCDNDKDFLDATNQGWKTFRIVKDIQSAGKDEVVCLNQAKGISCQDCRICNGSRRNVVITVHGSGKGNFQE